MCFLRLWTMNLCLSNQNPHWTRWCYRHIQQQNHPGWLSVAQTSKAGARKRLGHFTVSSQEEQIASALHDHSRDWPERGLCLPRGKLEWHGLAAQGGMWSGVTGTGVAWEAALFTAGLSQQPCLSNLFSVMQLWQQWYHPLLQAVGSLPEDILYKVWDVKKGSSIPVLQCSLWLNENNLQNHHP